MSLGGISPYTSTAKQIRIKIHKRNNTKHGTNNTIHSKYHILYKYTYYQNIHTVAKTPPYTLTHTLQNKLKHPQYKFKQTQYKICPN